MKIDAVRKCQTFFGIIFCGRFAGNSPRPKYFSIFAVEFERGGPVFSQSFCNEKNRYILLGNSGAMQTGWNYVDGNWYYFNSWGYMACGGWQYVGSVDYKFSSSGVMVGAWVDVPCYMQYPELPTGCESDALTNLLSY